MSTDRNILFGVQALVLDFIDSSQFVDACEDWAGRKDTSIAEILVNHRALTQDQREEVREMLDEQLETHDGDVRAALGAVADIRARDSIRLVKDREVQRTLNELPPPAEQVSVRSIGQPAAEASRYSNRREFREGGLGRTWLVHDDDLNRDVVLKELKPGHSDSEEARRRFLKEAQVTGQLEHPSIVAVYELGEGEAGRPFYTMRFVRGQTLLSAINAYHRRRRAGRADSLDERRLLIAFVHACNAIGYAHSRGVIHRDLKPENIVLGGFGEVILLDWGLAKLLKSEGADTDSLQVTETGDPNETQIGAVVGTPAYMAPEQAMGKPDLVDARTDIYGLGAVLFHILTGQPPHRGKDAAGVIRRINEGQSPRARTVRPSVRPGLNAICGVAMAKDREDRYATVSDLAEDMRRFLADEPVTAYRASVIQRIKRWTRHNRTAAAAALIACLSLVTGLANLTWQRSNAIEQETRLLAMETLMETGRLLGGIDTLRDDVLYLAEDHDIPGVLLSAGVDGEDKRKIETGFAEFLRHRADYLQARLLDGEGKELARVERNLEAATEPVAVKDLQPKGDRDYFLKAKGLPRGEVYLSKIELNKEYEQVDERRIPVIRASTPIHARDGETQADGVVVINMDLRAVFENLAGTPARADREFSSRTVYVVDRDGKYLWNPDDPSRTFGSSWIHVDHPELAAFFEPGGSEGGPVTTSEESPRVIYLQKVYPDAGDRNRFLAVAIAVPYEELVAHAGERYSFPLYSLVALSLALLVTVYLVVVLSRSRRWHPLRTGGQLSLHLAERLERTFVPRRRSARKRAE